jgi:hypothetical protein
VDFLETIETTNNMKDMMVVVSILVQTSAEVLQTQTTLSCNRIEFILLPSLVNQSLNVATKVLLSPDLTNLVIMPESALT